MAEGFLGEIRIFSGLKIPQNWMACNGQQLSVAEYQPLYALIGQTYGGNGSATFALPNLQGLLVAGVGQAPGMNSYALAQNFGSYNVQLTANQTSHSHGMQASTSSATSLSPEGNLYAAVPSSYGAYVPTAGSPTLRPLDSALLMQQGGNDTHSNMMPSLAFNYIICVNGLFPQFN